MSVENSKIKTRNRLVTLLRAGPQTVDQLARSLGVTANAVRMHLETLAREGTVRSVGQLRSGSAGKPAMLYEVTAAAEAAQSKAYAPALSALVTSLADEVDASAVEALLRATGRRLATVQPNGAAGLLDRARVACNLLNELGGVTTLENSAGTGVTLRSTGCPLGLVVTTHHSVCNAVEELVSAVVGSPARQHCVYHPRPSCGFTISDPA